MLRVIVSALVMFVGLSVSGGSAVLGPSAALAQDGGEGSSGDRMDRVVLSTGRTVEGRIIEETPTTITMEVTIGSLTAETTYQKSEIVEIRRDVGEAIEESDDAGEGRPSYDLGGGDESDEPKYDINDDTTRIYYAEIEGSLPLRLSKESMIEIFEDIDETFGDIERVRRGDEVVERVREEFRDRHVVVFKLDVMTDPQRAFGGINLANSLAPILRHEIDQKGRRVIFWVERAIAGGVFVPLTGPTIYFTPDGVMGGIGSLDQFDLGDEMVNEKLIGARLGVAEGYVIRSGYGENGVNVMRAMSRPQYELWVDRTGAEPETMLREPRASDGPNWERVAAAGQPFNMNAELAFDIGISEGTVRSVEELAFELGVDRNYVVLDDNDAEDEIDAWEDELIRALEKVVPNYGADLWEEYNDIEVEGDYRERRRAISQKISVLQQIRSVFRRYEDYLDPSGTQRAQIEVEIERWRQIRRGGEFGGGGGGGGGAGGGGRR